MKSSSFFLPLLFLAAFSACSVSLHSQSTNQGSAFMIYQDGNAVKWGFFELETGKYFQAGHRSSGKPVLGSTHAVNLTRFTSGHDSDFITFSLDDVYPGFITAGLVNIWGSTMAFHASKPSVLKYAGGNIYSIDEDGNLYKDTDLYQWQKNKLASFAPELFGGICSVAFDAQAEQFLLRGAEKYFVIDANSGEEMASYALESASGIQSFSYNAAAKTVIYLSADNHIKVYGLETGESRDVYAFAAGYQPENPCGVSYDEKLNRWMGAVRVDGRLKLMTVDLNRKAVALVADMPENASNPQFTAMPQLQTRSISGVVVDDVNSNGNRDKFDGLVAYEKVILQRQSALTLAWVDEQATFADANGYYRFLPDTWGNYRVWIKNLIPGRKIIQKEETFSVFDIGNFENANIMVQSGVKNDLSVSSYFAGRIRPGRVGLFQIYCSNDGSDSRPAKVSVSYSKDMMAFKSCSIEPSASGEGILDWDFGIVAGAWDTMVNVYFTIDEKMRSGDTVPMHVALMNEGDVNPEDNFDTTKEVITGSYDPNDIAVAPKEGKVLPGTKLTYTIRFQNTGNDTAFDVVVKNLVDENFDMETIKIHQASHRMMVQLEGRELQFIFRNILLPDSNVNEQLSHGFLSYSISPKAGLKDGVKVENTADIYFDFNAPVRTNTVGNVFTSETVGTVERLNRGGMAAFPNPSSSSVQVCLPTEFGPATYTVTDLLGRAVLRGQIAGTLILDLSGFAAGTYLFSARSATGSEGHLLLEKVE